MFKSGKDLLGIVQRSEQLWQGMVEKSILNTKEFQKNFSPLDRLSPSIELCEARGADETGKQGYGTSQRSPPADPQRSGVQSERRGRR